MGTKEKGTKQIPKKRMLAIQRKKERMLTPLFREDGSTKLPFGSYVKIARECGVVESYVRMVLNPKRREWNLDIFHAALAIIAKEAKEEIKLQKQRDDAIALHDKAFSNNEVEKEGGSDE